MTILINCIGKFCYRHWKFQNTGAATANVIKNFTNFTENTCARVSFWIKILRCKCFPVFLWEPFRILFLQVSHNMEAGIWWRPVTVVWWKIVLKVFGKHPGACLRRIASFLKGTLMQIWKSPYMLLFI